MMQCELCGTETSLVRALIEGTELSVCRSCASYGKMLRPIQPTAAPVQKQAAEKPKKIDDELIQMVVPDCGSIVKQKRERLGLRQEDLALKIAEKESLIHNLEAGRFIPGIALAKKLERFLKIRLIEEHQEAAGNVSKPKGATFTLGDFVRVRKR